MGAHGERPGADNRALKPSQNRSRKRRGSGSPVGVIGARVWLADGREGARVHLTHDAQSAPESVAGRWAVRARVSGDDDSRAWPSTRPAIRTRRSEALSPSVTGGMGAGGDLGDPARSPRYDGHR